MYGKYLCSDRLLLLKVKAWRPLL